jgi:hypothetical protein
VTTHAVGPPCPPWGHVLWRAGELRERAAGAALVGNGGAQSDRSSDVAAWTMPRQHAPHTPTLRPSQAIGLPPEATPTLAQFLHQQTHGEAGSGDVTAGHKHRRAPAQVLAPPSLLRCAGRASALGVRWARKRAGRALGARWARAAAQAASCSVRCVTRARTCMQLLAGAQVPVVDVCVARVLSGRRRPVRDAYAVRTLHARLAAACACSCQLQNCARSGPSLTPPGRGAPRSEISHVLRDAYWRDDLRAAADQKYARHGGLLAYLGEHGGWGVIENQPKDPREDEYAASKAARLQLRADAAAAKVARAAAKAAKAVATAAAKAAREEAHAAREAEKAERKSQRTQKQAARPARTRDAGAAGDAPTAAKRPKKDEAAATAVPAAAAV